MDSRRTWKKNADKRADEVTTFEEAMIRIGILTDMIAKDRNKITTMNRKIKSMDKEITLLHERWLS
jgi:hypothetical protein